MAGLLSTLLSGYGIYDQYDRLGDLQGDVDRSIGNIERKVNTGLEFRPYTFTSSLGGFNVTPDRQIQANLSQGQQQLQNQLFDASGGFLSRLGQGRPEREEDIYARIRAIQQPEEERQRLALENRLFGQGRLGLRTAQYGGSPEQFAMEKANAEARNQASLQAIQQAMQEQQQDFDLGTGLMKSGYLPQAQSLAAMQAANQLSQLGLTGQQEQANLMAQLGLGGLTQQVNLEQQRNNLIKQLFATGATALGGGRRAQTGQSGLMGLLGGLTSGGGLDGTGNFGLLGDIGGRLFTGGGLDGSGNFGLAGDVGGLLKDIGGGALDWFSGLFGGDNPNDGLTSNDSSYTAQYLLRPQSYMA